MFLSIGSTHINLLSVREIKEVISEGKPVYRIFYMDGEIKELARGDEFFHQTQEIVPALPGYTVVYADGFETDVVAFAISRRGLEHTAPAPICFDGTYDLDGDRGLKSPSGAVVDASQTVYETVSDFIASRRK